MMPTRDSLQTQNVPTAPTHLLSQKSIARQRDIFLFLDAPGQTLRLLGGLSSRRHPDLTISSFYRWLDILDSYEPKDRFDVWHINVTKFGVLSYTATRVGEPLPRESTDILQPGDYAAYCQDSNGDFTFKRIGPLGSYGTFTQRQDKLDQGAIKFPGNKITSAHNNLLDEIVEAVKERDKGLCFITGASSSATQVTWLVPPLRARDSLLLFQAEAPKVAALREAYKSPNNAITLSVDLAGHFMDNKFGIDVDDNYKIIVFQEFEGSRDLGTHLRDEIIMKLTDDSRHFLRGNFKYCLLVTFPGGDIIQEDYPDGGQGLLMCISEHRYGYRKQKRWQSRLGQEILEWYKDELPHDFDDDLPEDFEDDSE